MTEDDSSEKNKGRNTLNGSIIVFTLFGNSFSILGHGKILENAMELVMEFYKIKTQYKPCRILHSTLFFADSNESKLTLNDQSF